MSRTRSTVLALVLLLLVQTSFAQQQVVIKDHEYNPTAIVALRLARSSQIIPEADMPEVLKSLNQTGKVPRRFQGKFDSLLRTAQMILEIKGASHYFPVGFEFESGHHTDDSLEKFEEGSKAIEMSIRETFGTQGTAKHSMMKKEGDSMARTDIVDDAGAGWMVVQEYVRDETHSTTPTGWETVSPPIFNRDYLRNMASFVLRLGANPYGREAEFTGAHQTYNLLPAEAPYSSDVMARTAVNYMLLMEQFSPAIFKTLSVERYGGFQNFFIRPLVLDHSEILNELSMTDPKHMTMDWLQSVMLDKYAAAEYDVHFKNNQIYDAEDKAKHLAVSVEKKKGFAKLWKYHDLRLHFNKEKPERTLIETRIGDYREGSPEDILRVTYFNQLLLKAAYDMAKAGRVHHFQAPVRVEGETDMAYWERLSATTTSSQDELFNHLKIDEMSKQVLRGEAFEPRSPKFAALSKASYGYEKEFVGHEIVDLIVPIDPGARAKWRTMTHKQKVGYFAELFADPDQRASFYNHEEVEYTQDARRIVTVEFEADTMKMPHLDPDLFIEDSGSFEIKSNGRGIYDLPTLFEKMTTTDHKLETAGYGAHVHLFLPDSMIAAFKTEPGLAERAGGFIERLSLQMQLEDYRETETPGHWLDSWSIDRFSPRDITQVINWLKGQGPLGNIAQKYHNVGIREVKGGLDIELRGAGDDMDYMHKLMTYVKDAFTDKKFGADYRFGQSTPLFHDFTHIKNPKEGLAATLYDAVSKRHALTEIQKQLLFKLQFEIYKPAMAEYIFFENFYSHNSIDPKKMDTRMVRTNFESNVALPILDYEGQPYLQDAAKLAKIKAAREKFLEKVYRLMLSVEADPKMKFILQEKNFLHLADWLKRSEHPSRPDFTKVDPATSKAQQRTLDSLTKKLRGFVVQFTVETELVEMLDVSLKAEQPRIEHTSPVTLEREVIKEVRLPQRASARAATIVRRVQARSCSAMF